MKINISGHHVDITDGIRNAVNTKFEKVAKHFPGIIDLDIIVKVDGFNQSVEASLSYMGSPVSVSTEDKDMYVSIHSSAKKLEATLSKLKGQRLANRNSKDLEEIQEVLED